MKNPLDNLDEQLQQNIVMLAEETSERQIVEALRMPPPKGMNLWVSRAGLHAFLQRKRRQAMVAQTKEKLEEARQIAAAQEGQSGAKLATATLGLLQQRLFDEATGELKPSELLGMYRAAQQAAVKLEQSARARERADLSYEYLQLAKQRLELNAARLALAHADDLRSVIVDGRCRTGRRCIMRWRGCSGRSSRRRHRRRRRWQKSRQRGRKREGKGNEFASRRPQSGLS